MPIVNFPSRRAAKRNRSSEEGLEELTPVRVQEYMLEVESEKGRRGLVLSIVKKLEEEMQGELGQVEDSWMRSIANVQRLLSRCNTAVRAILDCDETLQHAVLGDGPMWWRVGKLQDRIEQLSSILACAENGVRSEWKMAAGGLEEFSKLVREFEADLGDNKEAA